MRDLHATLLHLLGLNHERLTCRSRGRRNQSGHFSHVLRTDMGFALSAEGSAKPGIQPALSNAG